MKKIFFFSLCISFSLAQGQVLEKDTFKINEIIVMPMKYMVTILNEPMAIIQPKGLQGITALHGLQKDASCYLRTNANGSLSTLSVRGGTSNQSTVYWNGFAVNNPALGMTDMSNLPVFFSDFNYIQHQSIDLGISSPLSMNIANNQYEQDSISANATVSISKGSYNNSQATAKLRFGNKHWMLDTRFYNVDVENNIRFYNQYLQRKDTLENAKIKQMGVMASSTLHYDNHYFSLHNLYTQADRQIPPTLYELNNKTNQKDYNWRSTANWLNVVNHKFNYTVAALFDRSILNFYQPLIKTSSENTFNQWSAFVNTSYRFSQFVWTNKIQHTYSSANSKNYQGLKYQNNTLFNSILTWQVNKWTTISSLQYNFQNKSYISGLLQTKYTKYIDKRNITIASLQLKRGLRLPTINERFWELVGNPDILAETSWGLSLDAEWDKLYKEKDYNIFKSILTVGTFARLVQNQIMWTPYGVIFQPENLGKVYNYGTELIIKPNFVIKKYNFQILPKLNYTFTRSFLSNNKANQTIYQPKHQLRNEIAIKWKKQQFIFCHNYTSKTYITSSNSQFLNSWNTYDIYWNTDINFKKQSLQLGIQCNNLANKTYETYKGRVMAPRTTYLTFQFTI